METRYIKYIIEIFECGSINKAAQYLGLQQPNLSVILKNIEDELGFDIFVRNHTGVKATGPGRLFIKSAKNIVNELEVIEKIPELIKNKENISLSCSYSFDIMNTFLKFNLKYPSENYEDSFKETGVIYNIRDVIEKRYRMSIFYCFDNMSKNYFELAEKYNFKMIPIALKCPLIVLASKKHIISRKKYLDFKDISKYKFVMYENFEFNEWLKILGFKDDKKILYVFDRGGLLDVIKQARHITVMMKRYTDIYSKECVEIPIINAPCNMNAYLIYQNNYGLNKRERAFIKELKSIFND